MLLLHVYNYAIVVLGGLLAYHGAPVSYILVIAALLVIPSVLRNPTDGSSAIWIALSAANTLIFAGLAYGVGRGVALLLAA
jgi:hypothetical protein